MLYISARKVDLYDFWYTFEQIPDLNSREIIEIFKCYMRFSGNEVSRAEFEKNIYAKLRSAVFTQDIFPLLSVDQRTVYSLENAGQLLLSALISNLKGDAWKALEKPLHREHIA